MANVVINAAHLGKRYTLGEPRTMLDRSTWLRNIRKRPELTLPTSFWALDDVSFEISEGEAVGIIGRNGAGKSTLLKVLSRITEPSRGTASIAGRVASLLEVGTGFHPELTGRENIFMNGSILGMRKGEISRVFDQIVEFAEIANFVDTPVKRYSSGMYVRLAFSVAAHLEPEVLIVDEVLAVGDIQFQKKCLGKMGDVGRSGRTVLFVSHNMTAVRQLTTRCIMLKDGNVFFDGAPERAIELYSDAAGGGFEQGADLARWPRAPLNLTRAVDFKSLSFRDAKKLYEPNEEIVVDVIAQARDSLTGLRVNGTIFESDGTPVGSFFSKDEDAIEAGQKKKLRVVFNDLRLAPGSYYFGLGLVQGDETIGHRDHDVLWEVLPFDITALNGDGGTLGTWYRRWGSVRLPSPPMQCISAHT